MNAIRIRRKLESDTLHLPELRPLIGREVEIVVSEEQILPSTILPGTGDWDAVKVAAAELHDGNYDFDAWKRQREIDLEHIRGQLP
jgi:hypothetical protein